MRRHRIKPRDGWQQTVESQGLTYHTVDGYAYWDESAYYSFELREIDVLEAASAELHRMCLQAVAHAIATGRVVELGVPAEHVEWVARSWRERRPTLYGRFDLAYDGRSPPKLLEYNADTPTALVEAAVAQWYWYRDCFPELDQWNSIHERLVEAWADLGGAAAGRLHAACLYEIDEDWMTINYLRDTAAQAGWRTTPIAVEDIGWNAARGIFVGERDEPIEAIFKLYPWEWLLREPFAAHLAASRTLWVEPAWKSLLSSKALLPLLWEMFPNHPNLLAAGREPLAGVCVRKCVHGREGANLQVRRGGVVEEETDGPYRGPYVYQEYVELPEFHERRPIVGTWIVDGQPCGMGVREDRSRITRNTSSFVPHVLWE